MDKDLEELVQVFGSEFSMEDIASTYWGTGQDKNFAAEILCTMQGTPSTIVTADESAAEYTTALELPSKLESETSTLSEISSNNVLDEASGGQEGTKELMSKRCSASMGNVSSVIGKEYANPRPSRNESMETKKPLKLQCLCGYDMQKSVDKLLDLSGATMERHEDADIAAKNEPMQQLDSVQSVGARMMPRNSSPKAKREKGKKTLEKELLLSLFDLPGRCEEAPTRIIPRRVVKTPKRFGKLVVEPLNDGHMQDMSSAAESLVSREEEEDDSYDVLRKAVKEYWSTTKEYYKAAIDAFSQGDHARANKLLEQGQFFNKRARETDKMSCEKLLETREKDEMISINLHDLEPKEALRCLRLHLTSLSGIPGVKYLRLVVVNNSDGDSTKGGRKKLIVKQLEKEGIKWEEEENGEKMLINVYDVDPKRLSFAKKEGAGDKGLKSPDLGYYF